MADKLLDEYENLKEIGQGSFARVYKVRHLQLDYIRAIRILNTPVSNEQDRSYQTFLKECKTLLQLGNGGHPNIVRIYQPRLLQNHALVEMDYIEGRDLDEYLKSQNHFVPMNEVLRFAHDICGALAYCHVDNYEFSYDINKTYEYKLDGPKKGKKFKIEPDPNDGSRDKIDDLQRRELIREYGITHNDLHSRNIMRKNYDGSYILLDFGLAIQNGQAVKSSSRQDGAVEYKAPEKGERGAQISPRSDIYGFGVLLYEMLAGRVPFPYDREKYSREEEALFRLSKQHEEELPPAIEPLRRTAFEAANPGETYKKDYPDWLEVVIMKCLAKKPQDRYADAKELFVELQGHMAETGILDTHVVNELRATNEALAKDLGSLAYEKTDLEGQIDALKKRLNDVGSNSGDDEIDRLKEEINVLKKRPETAKPKPVWKVLTGVFAACSLALLFSGAIGGFVGGFTEGAKSGFADGYESISSQLQQENAELKSQLENANSQIRQLTSENQTLRSNSRSSAALVDKQREIDRLQSENSSLKTDLRNATANQGSSTSNQQEIMRLQQRVASLEASAREKDNTISTQSTIISTLRQDLNTANQNYKTAQATIDRLLK